MDAVATLLRSYFAQRRTLGETEVLLQGIDAGEALRRLQSLTTESRGTFRDPGAALAEGPGESPATARDPRPVHGRAAGDLPDRKHGVEARPVRAGEERVATRASGEVARVAVPELTRLGDLAAVRSVAVGCLGCGLATTRKQVVFGEGNEQAELMVVGEAPGAEEDRTGRPFVGKAGQLLDTLLASAGFPRENVYICNVLKCRPPGNRNPQPDEIEACNPYLRRQIELVSPRVIVTVGAFASQTLLGTTESINRLRGRVHSHHGVPLVPTFHPAALLRNASWIRPTWDDFQRARALIDDHRARD